MTILLKLVTSSSSASSRSRFPRLINLLKSSGSSSTICSVLFLRVSIWVLEELRVGSCKHEILLNLKRDACEH